MTKTMTKTMTIYDAEDIYLRHAIQTYGDEWAETVGRFQEGFLRDGVCRDLDSAFAKAVETSLRLLPAIKARST